MLKVQPQTESTSGTERPTQTSTVYWTTREETQVRYVLNHIHAFCYRHEARSCRGGPRPSVRPVTRQEAVGISTNKGTKMNPYNLQLLCDTHCTHTLLPPPLPVLGVVMAASIKHTRCIHDEPIETTH